MHRISALFCPFVCSSFKKPDPEEKQGGVAVACSGRGKHRQRAAGAIETATATAATGKWRDAAKGDEKASGHRRHADMKLVYGHKKRFLR
jgi:hypothetical protein